jgi:hypothetical protein
VCIVIVLFIPILTFKTKVVNKNVKKCICKETTFEGAITMKETFRPWISGDHRGAQSERDAPRLVRY